MAQRPVDLGIARVNPKASTGEVQQSKNESGRDSPPLAVDLTPADIEPLRQRIIAQTRTIFDPEIPVNIYELGLIYDIFIKPDGAVNILMTLTTPACPVAGSLVGEVEQKIRSVANVTSAKVDLVWDPPWDKSRMSEAARLQLGIDDW